MSTNTLIFPNKITQYKERTEWLFLPGPIYLVPDLSAVGMLNTFLLTHATPRHRKAGRSPLQKEL